MSQVHVPRLFLYTLLFVASLFCKLIVYVGLLIFFLFSTISILFAISFSFYYIPKHKCF